MSIQPSRADYRQVADILRQEIEAGTHAPGSVLPSEQQLADRFGVSRVTVNKGVAILRSEGYVRVERGQGTVVRTIPAITRNAGLRFSRAFRESGHGAFETEVRAAGLEPGGNPTRISTETAPDEIAGIFGLEGGTQVVVRRRQPMTASGVPVQLADSYIPLAIAEGTQLMERDTGTGGSLSRLADLGHAVGRVTERLRVRTPGPGEASVLQMDEEQRVYEITRTSWTADGVPVEVTVHVMPTHFWVLEYGFPVEG